jgi:4-phytase/acid phosphatase
VWHGQVGFVHATSILNLLPLTPPEIKSMLKHFAGLACLLALSSSCMQGQTAPPKAVTEHVLADAQLRMVVVVGRHGVRSPTGKASQYNVYSAAPWPSWDVAPGFLTPHGFHLMELFGAWDRTQFAAEGLFPADGCTGTSTITLYADSDQRTRETAKALSRGLFPGCDLPVQGLAEGTNDPIFHPASASHADAALAVAAISGRIGGDPSNLAVAYHAPLAALDGILARCGGPSAAPSKRTSLFDVPATLSAGNGDHLAELKGPLSTAATLSENMLLEYTEDMDAANVGWGCVDGKSLRQLMDLHTAATDFAQRTSEIAITQSAPLLAQIRLAFGQAVSGSAASGALGKPSDRALFLIGHDTSLENIAGALHLTWIADGRRDDTPPGSALVFELWKKPVGDYVVRTYFTSQTLEQMRFSTELGPDNPPIRVPVFIPACSGEDLSCPLARFLAMVP